MGTVAKGGSQLVIQAEQMKPVAGTAQFAAFEWVSTSKAPAPWNKPGQAMGDAMIALSPNDAGRRERTAYAGRIDGDVITPGLTATFQVKKPGKYIVWVRASGPNDDHNSLRFLIKRQARWA